MISVQMEVSYNGDSADTNISIQKGMNRNAVEYAMLLELIRKLTEDIKVDMNVIIKTTNTVKVAPYPTEDG